MVQISNPNDGQTNINRPYGRWTMRAEKSENRLLFLFLDRSRGLRCLCLDHALLEFVHASGGIDELLRASVKGMARIADTDNNYRLGGAGLNHVATGATDFRVHIFGMYGFFHKRPENIASIYPMTSGKFPGFQEN